MRSPLIRKYCDTEGEERRDIASKFLLQAAGLYPRGDDDSEILPKGEGSESICALG